MSAKGATSISIISWIVILLVGTALMLFTADYFLVQGNNPLVAGLISPLVKPDQALAAENIWLPQEATATTYPNAPEISAQTAFFVDIDTGQVLYQKDPHHKMPIASLMKVMTAIITLEHREPSALLSVSSHASEMEPDKMYVQTGEELSVRDLLSGLFLVSANDAAEVLAERVTGNRDQFIGLMNQKANQLGMSHTLFTNPTGLDEDVQKHYSSAYDAALMARYAIKKWPFLTDITSEPYLAVSATSTHRAYDLYSGINLVTTYQGVKGFKTGYTPEAGLTLITYAEQSGHKILGVLLNAPSRREDAKVLLDYCFSALN